MAVIPKAVADDHGGSPEELIRDLGLTEDWLPPEAVFGLKRFLASIAGVIDQQPISRQDILLYVANKAGGVHLDHSRSGGREAVFRLLDRPTYNKGGVSAVFMEVASMAHAIAVGPDTMRFLQAAQEQGRIGPAAST